MSAENKSFFTTLPGILTGIAALIAAVTTSYTVVRSQSGSAQASEDAGARTPGGEGDVPGGGPLYAVAHGRLSDIVQRAQNLRTLVKDIEQDGAGEARPLNRVNDLNNGLTDMWKKAAGYGIGSEPFTEAIAVSPSGYIRPELGSSFGEDEQLRSIGLPRLYERCPRAQTHVQSQSQLAEAVRLFWNPQAFPHKEFHERAYNDYRVGRRLTSKEFERDLDAVDEWLDEVIDSLRQADGLFRDGCGV